MIGIDLSDDDAIHTKARNSILGIGFHAPRFNFAFGFTALFIEMIDTYYQQRLFPSRMPSRQFFRSGQDNKTQSPEMPHEKWEV
jgi:hypothetical protein